MISSVAQRIAPLWTSIVARYDQDIAGNAVERGLVLTSGVRGGGGGGGGGVLVDGGIYFNRSALVQSTSLILVN